jgi:hypothetical protein
MIKGLNPGRNTVSDFFSPPKCQDHHLASCAICALVVFQEVKQPEHEFDN